MYGCYSSIYPSHITLIKIGNKYKTIPIPIMNAHENTRDYISKTLKKSDDFSIEIKKIPFNTELLYKGHNVIITGSGEIVNNQEFKILAKYAKKWKYALNYVFNQKFELDSLKNMSVLELDNQLNEIINYIIEKQDFYPLYKHKLLKIKEIGKIYELDIPEKLENIKKIFIMLSANKTNVNLKEIGLSEREGRLKYSNIDAGILTFKSITGIKEKKYEF